VALSGRCAVAIHALTMLARWEQDEHLLTSGEIAESLESNPVLVRRILGALRDAGLVTSVEGRGGGWRLVRPAEEITLLDAYLAVEEGPVLPLHPHPPSSSCVVGRNMQALLEVEFAEAERAMADRLRQRTIAYLLRQILRRDARVSSSG
jgi:Rrf2 family protein